MASTPTVLIASSDSALELARSVQVCLTDVATCTHQVDLRSSADNRLEALVRAAADFDFALVVFSPDDALQIRERTFQSVRDTVMFEFGVLLGKKGRDHVFALGPDDGAGSDSGFRTISDLQGITMLRYGSTGSIAARIDKPCKEIGGYIQQRWAQTTHADVFRDIARNITEIKDIVQEISHSAKTRYLGQFPQFFQANVLACVDHASKDFFLACDFSSYGFFSAYATHEEFVKALERRRHNGVDIHALFLSESRRRNITRLQVPKDWAAAVGDPQFKELLAGFSDRIFRRIDSADVFEQCVNDSHETHLTHFLEKIDPECSEIDAPMPVYLWIADNKRAVFAIPQFGAELTEHGFETVDPFLVDSLRGLWQRYSRGSVRARARRDQAPSTSD